MEKLLHNCNCTKGRHSKPRSSFKYRLLRISSKENSTQHMSSISWAEILRASLEKAVHVRSTVRGPCRRVLLDIRYLVRHSIPNWSGRLPLNPVQRPRTTFFYFSCVIVDRLSYLIILYKPRCRMRAKKGEREREKRDRRVRTFPGCCWFFDEIMARHVSFSLLFFFLWFFRSNRTRPRSSILILFTNGTRFQSVEYSLTFSIRINLQIFEEGGRSR